MYDYRAAMREDIEKYIEVEGLNLTNYKTRDDAFDDLYDIMWTEDSITGNTDWYDSEYNCEEYLCHNSDLAIEACIEFCIDTAAILKHVKNKTLMRYLDCMVRCYLLGEILGEVLDNYEWSD